MIDLFYPALPREAIESVSDTLRSRFIGQGPKVEAFEKEFQKKFGVKYAVSLSSGTAALETAFDLIGISDGDEVISTPLTCTATNLMLLRRGVHIIWADIDPDTLCIDQDSAWSRITPKTKAIVQVHLGGIPAKVHTLNQMELTNRYGRKIPVVSDAAQALGVFVGDYTCCSFQAIKHITTGDGGMLVCDTERHRNEAKLLRWFGIDRDKKVKNNWQAYTERKMTFDIKFPGTKRQMNDIAASLGLAGLSYYDEVMAHRKKIFEIYRRDLPSDVKLVDGEGNTYWLATILVEKRDDFARMMFEAGIDVNTVHVRNDIYKVFGGKRADLPVMNKLEEKYISIPLNMRVSEDDAIYITQKIKEGW